jgi:hypothetical protein
MTKAFNLSPINIMGDFVMNSNQYNAVYADISTPSTLTIPVSAHTLDGFIIAINNVGTATLAIQDPDSTFSEMLPSGQSIFLFSDTYSGIWKVLSGPITSGGGSGISGPVSSTDNAIVLWNGTTGSTVKNSNITVVGNTISTASGNLTINSIGGTIDFGGTNLTGINSIVTNNITNTSGTYQTYFGTKITIVGVAPANILSIPIPTNSSTNITLNVSVTNESNLSDSASYTLYIRVKNISSTISWAQYGTFSSLDASLNSASISLLTSGGNFIIQGTGSVGITTGYQASATSSGISF